MARQQNLKHLGEVADIRTGYTFRGKIEEVAPETGNAHIAQIKDARKIWEDTQSTVVTANQLPLIFWDGKPQAFIQPESVLLPSRGGYFRALYLAASDEAALPVIASSQFLVIKPSAAVLAEFLCWSLNRPKVQRNLLESSQGSNIPMLNSTSVKQLQIGIPPLETQQKILHLNRLGEEEQKLTQALLKNRELMLQCVFQQLINGEEQ